jgi:hypothetical protein
MNSENAPMDDDAEDAVFTKALHFLSGRTQRPDVEFFAHKLADKFFGQDDEFEIDETTPIGVVSNVSPDGKQVTIKKTDGSELKTTGDAVVPGPDGKTAALSPAAGSGLKPGTPVTSGQEQAVSEEPNEDISFAGLTQHDNGDLSYNVGPLSMRKKADGSSDSSYTMGDTTARVQQNPIGVKTLTAKGSAADAITGVDASAFKTAQPANESSRSSRPDGFSKNLNDMLRIAGLK